MEQNRYMMRPGGGNQFNPFFVPQTSYPINPQINYPVNFQVRQCISVSVTAPFNAQMMCPFNPRPFPSSNPQVNPSAIPCELIPTLNPQIMTPVNQQMIPVHNPTPVPIVNPQPVPPVNRLSVPRMSQPAPVSGPPIPHPIYRPPVPRIMNSPSIPTSIPTPINRTPIPRTMNRLSIPHPISQLPMLVLGPQPIPTFDPLMGPPMNCQPFRPAKPQVVHMVPPPINPQPMSPHIPQQFRPFSPEPVPPANAQSIPPVTPQTTEPVNTQTVPVPRKTSPSVKFQPLPSVNPQVNTKIKPPTTKTTVTKKRKEDRRSKRTIFWEDVTCKVSDIIEESDETDNQDSAMPQTKRIIESKPDKKTKKIKKTETASKPNEEKPSDDSSDKNVTLINVNVTNNETDDETKTTDLKNLKSSPVVSGKKRANIKDKGKSKVIKVFGLMQKLKGVSKKLWQNVAANGEFKDNPEVPMEATKMSILAHKFSREVDCLVWLAKKEKEKESVVKKPEDNNQTEQENVTQSSEDGDSKKSIDKKPAQVSKPSEQRHKTTVMSTVKDVMKKLNILDDLGLCFVNLNDVFIRKFCSMIVKLRKSLHALMEKPKGTSKKKRLSLPKQPCLPVSAAITITCFGRTSYDKALNLALQSINFKKMGIKRIEKRQALTGGLVLEIFADDYDKKADKLAAKLRGIYKSLDIRISRPHKCGDLVIKKLDPTATVEKIIEELVKLGKYATNMFKPGSKGKTCIWVRCPLNIALELDQKTIQIGSTVSRINLKAEKLVRCYKCFNTGHVKHQCRSLFDHNNVCFKCGEGEHEARNCQNVPKCLTCLDSSLPTYHRLGGEKCPSAIPKIIPLSRYDGSNCPGFKKKRKKGKKRGGQKKRKVQTNSISRIPKKEEESDQIRSRN